ncbi:ABC transporter ATP-binding protein [Maribacter sp. M208]|uniref:ABC transporter ATP-binding protein n=1 Tax=Maribacter huludaoensis TaxID=3030010 RepID=UPI0023EA8DC3|nr:ABC transporter ATP-binding protein [Maribacter huludaoensis]MDF4221070.1 ABC transporter ATP-binding protein [Maribacter huludaoensis]
MENIIVLEKVNKSYFNGEVKTHVLNDFSWSFERGCFTILAGPSGSGKSTILNIMGTLDNPTDGRYYLNDKLVDFSDNRSLTSLRRKNFGFIFQSFNLIPVLTAIENVELPLTLLNLSSKQRRKMSIEALKAVGLEKRMNNRPGQMSGGEQQRVAVARAIARKPEVIFADEPTASLDKENAINIINLMKNLNIKTGISFIIASHDEKVILSGKDVITVGDLIL